MQKNIGTDKTLKQLREELNQIKQQNQELKSRLENLEAKSNSEGTGNGERETDKRF